MHGPDVSLELVTTSVAVGSSVNFLNTGHQAGKQQASFLQSLVTRSWKPEFISRGGANRGLTWLFFWRVSGNLCCCDAARLDSTHLCVCVFVWSQHVWLCVSVQTASVWRETHAESLFLRLSNWFVSLSPASLLSGLLLVPLLLCKYSLIHRKNGSALKSCCFDAVSDGDDVWKAFLFEWKQQISEEISK